MPTSAHVRCLLRTYTCELGSSPTSTVASPGVMPCCVSALTRSRSSSLTAAAIALPSRIVAAMLSPLTDGRLRPAPPFRSAPGLRLHAPPGWLVVLVVEVALAGEDHRDAVL